MESAMKHAILLGLASICAVTTAAAPAYAKSKHHYNEYHYYPTQYGYMPQPSPYQQAYYQPAPITRTTVHCDNNTNPLGLVLGGAAGGIVGNSIGKGKGKTAAIITGAVLGSAIGGSSMGRECHEEVFHQAPVGVPVTWQSASNSNYYTITPMQDMNLQGRYCREYQAVAQVGGRSSQTYGTACMQPDGSWEIVN
jgi:surface antigen